MAQQPRRTPYTSLNVPVSTRDELTALAIELSTRTGRRISMASAARAAVRVAQDHMEEVVDALEEEG